MTHKVSIYTRSGNYHATIYVRDRGGEEFKEVARFREDVERITGEFPVACWHDFRGKA